MPDTNRDTALITGASSGIGAELARLFAANGYGVVLVASRAARLEQLAAELSERFGVPTTAIPKDLSEPGAPRELYDEVRRRGLEIGILVNNAGFSVYGPFAETPLDAEQKMLQVNIGAVVALTKLFLRDMAARRSGRILNIGSTGSFAPGPFGGVYCATKAFVLSFSEAIAEELKGSGVTVTALCPGATDTEFARRAGMTDTNIFRGRLMTAREVAEIGFDALMRGRRTVVAGFSNKALIWSLRFAPRALVARVSKGMMSLKPQEAAR